MRRLVVPLAAVVLALVRCSGSSSDEDGSGGTDATVADVTGTTGSTTETTEAPEGPAVDLVDAGAEPRGQLRLALTPGTTMAFTSSTTIDQSVDGASPGPITTTYDVTTEVLSVQDGIARVRATYGNPRVDTEATANPEVAAGAEQAAAIFDGAVAELAVDERGQVTDADFTPGADAGVLGETVIQQLLDNLLQQSVVLPEEPIGVGGQWVLRSTIDAGGVLTTTEQTFTVVGLDAAGVDLTFVVTGTFSGGGEGTSTGSGTVRVSFDSFLSDTEATTTNAMTAQGSEVDQQITQSVHRAPAG